MATVLPDTMLKTRVIERIQAIWRGRKTRREVAKKNAEEIAATETHWRSYDECYRIYVVCQTLMVELMKDDERRMDLLKNNVLWDPTETPFYVWMCDVGGPWLAVAEEYMRIRGWRRPAPRPVDPKRLKAYLLDAANQCGVPNTTAEAFLSIAGSFKVPDEWEV
jgi:hypothetical protein